TGVPGFEMPRGVGRERLEAAQRQVLQVHPHLPQRSPLTHCDHSRVPRSSDRTVRYGATGHHTRTRGRVSEEKGWGDVRRTRRVMVLFAGYKVWWKERKEKGKEPRPPVVGVAVGLGSTELRPGSMDPKGRQDDAYGVPVQGSVFHGTCRNIGRHVSGSGCGSGERRLAVGCSAHVVNGHVELVVTCLKSADLGFEVTYSIPQPSHLLNHPRVGAADVAKQSLRHDVGPPH